MVLWAFKIPKSLFVHVEIYSLIGYCSFAVLVASAILIAVIAENTSLATIWVSESEY